MQSIPSLFGLKLPDDSTSLSSSVPEVPRPAVAGRASWRATGTAPWRGRCPACAPPRSDLMFKRELAFRKAALAQLCSLPIWHVYIPWPGSKAGWPAEAKAGWCAWAAEEGLWELSGAVAVSARDQILGLLCGGLWHSCLLGEWSTASLTTGDLLREIVASTPLRPSTERVLLLSELFGSEACALASRSTSTSPFPEPCSPARCSSGLSISTVSKSISSSSSSSSLPFLPCSSSLSLLKMRPSRSSALRPQVTLFSFFRRLRAFANHVDTWKKDKFPHIINQHKITVCLTKPLWKLEIRYAKKILIILHPVSPNSSLSLNELWNQKYLETPLSGWTCDFIQGSVTQSGNRIIILSDVTRSLMNGWS